MACCCYFRILIVIPAALIYAGMLSVAFFCTSRIYYNVLILMACCCYFRILIAIAAACNYTNILSISLIRTSRLNYRFLVTMAKRICHYFLAILLAAVIDTRDYFVSGFSTGGIRIGNIKIVARCGFSINFVSIGTAGIHTGIRKVSIQCTGWIHDRHFMIMAGSRLTFFLIRCTTFADILCISIGSTCGCIFHCVIFVITGYRVFVGNCKSCRQMVFVKMCGIARRSISLNRLMHLNKGVFRRVAFHFHRGAGCYRIGTQVQFVQAILLDVVTSLAHRELQFHGAAARHIDSHSRLYPRRDRIAKALKVHINLQRSRQQFIFYRQRSEFLIVLRICYRHAIRIRFGDIAYRLHAFNCMLTFRIPNNRHFPLCGIGVIFIAEVTLQCVLNQFPRNTISFTRNADAFQMRHRIAIAFYGCAICFNKLIRNGIFRILRILLYSHLQEEEFRSHQGLVIRAHIFDIQGGGAVIKLFFKVVLFRSGFLRIIVIILIRTLRRNYLPLIACVFNNCLNRAFNIVGMFFTRNNATVFITKCIKTTSIARMQRASTGLTFAGHTICLIDRTPNARVFCRRSRHCLQADHPHILISNGVDSCVCCINRANRQHKIQQQHKREYSRCYSSSHTPFLLTIYIPRSTKAAIA